MQLLHSFCAKSRARGSKDTSLILSDFLQIMAVFDTVEVTLSECQELLNNTFL